MLQILHCVVVTFLFYNAVLYCCFAAGVMVVDDSQPVSGDIDVCDTLPLFLEDWGIHEECLPAEPKPDAAPLVFTSGPVDVPDTPSIANSPAHGSEPATPDSGERPVKKPRTLPPVPKFEPSKPDESTVP